MTQVIIKPVKQRTEVIAVLSTAAVILLLATLLITTRKEPDEAIKKLKYYQVNGAEVLNAEEFKVFSDLYGVGRSEIRTKIREENGAIIFPTIPELKSSYVSPFTGGFLYKKYGDHQWVYMRTDTKKSIKVLYYGKAQKPEIAGSFIFLIEGYYQLDGVLQMKGINKDEKLGRIWYKAGKFELPKDINEGNLISLGWKEVVNLSGKDKRESGGNQ